MKTYILEKENYALDRNLSIDQKLENNRQKEHIATYIDGVEQYIVVLKKQILGKRKNAYIWEYTDDGILPKHLAEEQLFTWNAVLNLGLEKMLPEYMQVEHIPSIKETYFQKGGRDIFPGYRSPNNKRFDHIGDWVGCWLSNGDYIGIYKGKLYCNHNHHNFGFSLRFLKTFVSS